VTTILCVDDDPYLTDLLRFGLAHEGFAVVSAATGREGLRRARTEPIDLVLLDVNMPDMNGVQVLTTLRAFSDVPIIMLTARAQEADILAGFGQGADDYVVKPFSMGVLATRVKALLRRADTQPLQSAESAAERMYRVAGALLDTEAHELAAPDGTRVRLTVTESRILQALVTHEGKALSAARIMERIWSDTSQSDVNVVKTHVRHLREKLARLPGHPHPIRTLPGVGYVLSETSNMGETEDARTVRGVHALA